MKKYAATIILVGIIIILGAVLSGVLIYLKNQPPQQRAFQPITTVKPLEPDSSIWGLNFPNEYSSLLQTAANATSTKYGGSAKLSYLTLDPRLVILFAGFSFSMDYNQPRGHQDTLIDVQATKRVTATTHATCYSCKSSDNPTLWAQMGMTAYDSKLFSAMTPASPNPSAAPTATRPGPCAWSSPTRPWTPPSKPKALTGIPIRASKCARWSVPTATSTISFPAPIRC